MPCFRAYSDVSIGRRRLAQVGPLVAENPIVSALPRRDDRTSGSHVVVEFEGDVVSTDARQDEEVRHGGIGKDQVAGLAWQAGLSPGPHKPYRIRTSSRIQGKRRDRQLSGLALAGSSAKSGTESGPSLRVKML